MPQTIITAGDATITGVSTQGGDDGTLRLVVGPNGGKIPVLTIDAAGTSVFARQVTSTAGNFNLKTNTVLTNANATLNAAQMLQGQFSITPTVARILTTATAVDIIAAMPGYQIGSHFDFSIQNNAAFDVTLIAGVGVALVGNMVVNNGNKVWRCRIDSASAVTIRTESVVASGIILGTPITTTGAGSFLVTGLSASAKIISFAFDGVSVDGVQDIYLLIGPSSGLVSTGYAGAVFDGITNIPINNAFYISNFASAAAVLHGRATLQLIDASTNTWSWTSYVLSSDSNRSARTAAGTISLASTLERFQLTIGSGAFDAGKFNHQIFT